MNDQPSAETQAALAALAAAPEGAARPTAAQAEAVRREHAWSMWYIRFAEILNRHATSMRHGGRVDYTPADAMRILNAVIDSEATVAGLDSAEGVSSGFGEPVRVQENAAIEAAICKLMSRGVDRAIADVAAAGKDAVSNVAP